MNESGPAAPEPVAQADDRLWSAADVARFLGVHRNWVYSNAGRPHLPCVRIGALLRFDPEVIRGLGRARQTGTSSASSR